jgi:hypothetical protein
MGDSPFPEFLVVPRRIEARFLVSLGKMPQGMTGKERKLI